MNKMQTRIYIPGILADEAYKSIKGIEGIIELRNGFALPILPESQKTERVWHVDAENPSIPPKFHAMKKNLIRAHAGELVQYRRFPRELNSEITTSSYLQSKVSSTDLECFGELGPIRIYDGELPIPKGNYRRADGTVILTGLNTLEEIKRIYEKSRFGMTITKESLIFASNPNGDFLLN